MNLRFNIPKFYLKRYGVEENLDIFCERIVNAVREKSYSKKVDSIDFIPIIVPKDMLSEELGKEFTKYDLRYKVVTLGRQINFEDYNSGDELKKKTILLECLTNGLKEIEKKTKLDVDAMIADIKSAI